MEHQGTKTITTNRLTLRQFVISDASAMYKNYANDPEVTKYLTWPTHENVEVSEGLLTDWTGKYNENDFYFWAIVLRENGDVPIGGISVVHKNDDVQAVEIGYCIGKQWWNQGIVSEALDGVIRYFFCEVGLNRIEAKHDPRNPNSGKVMQKCGMRYEGTLREADRNNQGICDSAIYAILAKEFQRGASK